MNKKYPSICNTFVKLSFFLFLSLFYSDTYSQNVGIGSATPTHSFHVVREMTGGNNRSLSEFQLTNNNVLIQGTFSGAYHRNDLTNTTTSTAVKVVNLSSGDEIRVEGRRSLGSGHLKTKSNGSSLLIERL